METFVVFDKTSETNREYLKTLHRANYYTDKDIGEAIEFPNKELAISIANYLNDREECKTFYVLKITTTEEVIS